MTQACRFPDKPENKQKAKIAVCKDVVKQILSEKYATKSSCGYIVPHTKSKYEPLIDDLVPVKTAFNVVQKECNVCAKGALLLSSLRKFDGSYINDIAKNTRVVHNDSIVKELDGLFSRDELDLIEIAFEVDARINDYRWRNDDYDARLAVAEKVRDKFSHVISDNDRLVAIMRHIIKNKGEVNFT